MLQHHLHDGFVRGCARVQVPSRNITCSARALLPCLHTTSAFTQEVQRVIGLRDNSPCPFCGVKETLTQALFACSDHLRTRNNMCRALQPADYLCRSIEVLILPVGSRRDAGFTFNALLECLTETGLADRLLSFPPEDFS